MELLIVHLTDIHIRDDADFDILSERIGSTDFYFVGSYIDNQLPRDKKDDVIRNVFANINGAVILKRER